LNGTIDVIGRRQVQLTGRAAVGRIYVPVNGTRAAFAHRAADDDGMTRQDRGLRTAETHEYPRSDLMAVAWRIMLIINLSILK
jgi:hypothetical protein